MKVIDVPLKYEDGTSPKAIMFTAEECLHWGGFNVCDFCNEDTAVVPGEEGYSEETRYGYVIPNVYGSGYAICKKCYDKFLSRGVLYEEDRRPEEEKEIIEYYQRFNLE